LTGRNLLILGMGMMDDIEDLKVTMDS
jgi:hypothetical protein